MIKHKPRIHNLEKQKKIRKKLRNNLTKAEVILWSKLKGKQTGCKFRRQHGIGNYIVDFYCPELNLAVEIDGDSHFLNETAEERDKRRGNFIKKQGIEIKRYTNSEVVTNLGGVVDDLYMTIEKLRSG